MAKQVILEFPANIPIKKIDEKMLKKAKEVFVLELLRKGKISQGKAAELLEINRWDLFDLMAKYDIPAIDMTSEELEKELKSAKEIFREKQP